MRHFHLILIIVLGLILFSSISVFAQNTSLPVALSLEIQPPSPSPGQSVTVKAYTPTLDTATTFFDWSVDGVRKSELSGYGNNTIQLTAGAVGTLIRASVAITGSNGQPAQSSITIYPSTVALSWYAQTYTPAWYRGKALPTPNSVVIVTATPHIVINGVMLKPENLIYTWGYEDRDWLLTGVGKQAFNVQMPDQADVDQQVRVIVEDLDHRIRKEGSIFITTTLPRAAIYRLTPLGGIDPRAAASVISSFKHETIDLQAEPFFFPTLFKKDIRFQWSIGGLAPQGNPQNPFITTIEAGDPNLASLPVSTDVSQPQPNNLVARALASVLMFFK
ncbi:MAG: hypothetical protein HY617_00255 [Candidatus Sungbacteria bacterium]|nr:hypothetical protein [Candidatus Sungbacteria bacterium]